MRNRKSLCLILPICVFVGGVLPVSASANNPIVIHEVKNDVLQPLRNFTFSAQSGGWQQGRRRCPRDHPSPVLKRILSPSCGVGPRQVQGPCLKRNFCYAVGTRSTRSDLVGCLHSWAERGIPRLVLLRWPWLFRGQSDGDRGERVPQSCFCPSWVSDRVAGTTKQSRTQPAR